MHARTHARICTHARTHVCIRSHARRRTLKHTCCSADPIPLLPRVLAPPRPKNPRLPAPSRLERPPANKRCTGCWARLAGAPPSRRLLATCHIRACNLRQSVQTLQEARQRTGMCLPASANATQNLASLPHSISCNSQALPPRHKMYMGNQTDQARPAQEAKTRRHESSSAKLTCGARQRRMEGELAKQMILAQLT